MGLVGYGGKPFWTDVGFKDNAIWPSLDEGPYT